MKVYFQSKLPLSTTAASASSRGRRAGSTGGCPGGSLVIAPPAAKPGHPGYFPGRLLTAARITGWGRSLNHAIGAQHFKILLALLTGKFIKRHTKSPVLTFFRIGTILPETVPVEMVRGDPVGRIPHLLDAPPTGCNSKSSKLRAIPLLPGQPGLPEYSEKNF